MKTSKRTIEQLNADLFLDDVKILWTGQTVALTLNGKMLTVLEATADIQTKIVRWLNKNCMRCTQMHDGRIHL